MSQFLEAICANLAKFTDNVNVYEFPELEFTIEKPKNFQIIDERNFHYDVQFFEDSPSLPIKQINQLTKDLTGKVIRTPKGQWEIQVKFLSSSHGILLSFSVKKSGIYINEAASAFTKEINMTVLINSQQFKTYNEELFIVGSQLKTKKIREFFDEGHKDREVKIDLTPFTQNILAMDTKQIWGPATLTAESYYSTTQPIERKYPKRIVIKECVINAKKISLQEISEIVNDMKIQEEKAKKQQEQIRVQKMKEREAKRKKEEVELAQKGSQIQELAKFYKEQKIADKLYSITTSALSSLPTVTPAPFVKPQPLQYYYQNPLSLEYIYGGRGGDFMLQEFESSLSWGNDSFGYKGIIQKQLKEMKEKDKKKKFKGIRPIAQEHKEKHVLRPIKKIKIQ